MRETSITSDDIDFKNCRMKHEGGGANDDDDVDNDVDDDDDDDVDWCVRASG